MLLHVTTYLQGGAGRAVTDLAIAARRAGRAVAVAATRTPVPGFENYPQYLEALRGAGVPVILVDSTFQRSPEAIASAAAAICAAMPAASPPTLVHAHAGTPARVGLALAAAARAGGRRVLVVQTMHGWGTNKSPAQERDDLATLAQVDAVVVTSRASLDELVRRGLDQPRIDTIPCGLPAVPPLPPVSDAVVLEALARRASGAAVLLSIGTLNANKNQVTLVRSLPAILAVRPALCLFVGEGPGMAALEEEGRRLGVAGSMRLAGYRPEAAAWLSVADLLVQPSLSEGQGLSVLEAFRAGVPVAASDIPAHRELIGDGSCGWLFDPRDPAGVARAVNQVLDADPGIRLRVTARAREIFLSRYTLDAAVAAHERLYASLPAGHR